MPVIKSAIKKLRKDKTREKRNDLFRKNLDTLLRQAKKTKTPASISKAFSAVDKAVKKEILHKNKAARMKSALSKLSKPGAVVKKVVAAPKSKAKAPVKKTSKKKAKK